MVISLYPVSIALPDTFILDRGNIHVTFLDDDDTAVKKNEIPEEVSGLT